MRNPNAIELSNDQMREFCANFLGYQWFSMMPVPMRRQINQLINDVNGTSSHV